jgi:hypothetical protein
LLKQHLYKFQVTLITFDSFLLSSKILKGTKNLGISYDFDQKNYMFWKLVNSFKMMK